MSKTKTTLTSCILQATKMCAKVQILFQHKKQDDSVISLKCVKLLGLGSVSNVAPKQKEIKKEGIVNNVYQERSFFTKSLNLVQ